MQRTLPILLSLVAFPAIAEGTRELSSHEHGVGELNIAIDNKSIAMELHAPGADIVGFEHAATSEADRETVEKALATLEKPLALFSVPAAAQCTVTKAHAALEDEDDHDDDHDGHEDHHDAQESHEAHDDHKEGHDDHDHDKHDHDDHAGEAGHTEFHAEYMLNCENPSALTNIEFGYFAEFPNSRELEVQIVSPAGAKAFEVERGAPSLDLGDLF